ncbi:unnamed protein product [Prorocentrum cordatum]|uniref:RING-type E3 ubiquitin transferase n=1 Tax=Prorocentrum cordatum TaxID=2364126 RepID=A0ABN9XNE4_9DINO|nr:unnamed protein product [Polarella glacialis]
MAYAARAVDPAAAAAPLAAFDSSIRDACADIFGFQPTEDEWLQATLGFRRAGLGFRSSLRHSAAAHFASRAAARGLCAQVDAYCRWDVDDAGSGLQRAAATLQAALPEQAARQLAGTSPASLRDRLARASLAVRAAVLSGTLPGASGFLTAMPSKAMKLSMGPTEFRTEVQCRLAAEVSQEDYCPLCDSVLDAHGFHCSVCACGGGKSAAHHAAGNLTHFHAASAGCRPDLDRGHLLPPRPGDAADPGLRRTADVFLPSWRGGPPAAVDLAIASPQRQAAFQQASEVAGSAAQLYEDYKRSYLDTEAQCPQQGIAFVPMVAERSGGWGASGIQVLQPLARKAQARDGKAASLHMQE